MTHLGVYYCPEHHRQEDRDYIRKLEPPVIRLLDPDVQQIADMHALAPNAVIACRTWAIDDNNGAAVRALNANPVAAANDHAQQYRGQLDRWKQEAHDRGLSLPVDDHIYFNSANEPNQGGELAKIATYSVAFLNRCTELGLRATAPCLGVGWPDNTGPGTPVNWQPYIDAGLEQAIQRGGHWLEVHEYHYKDGPQNNWTWWAGRHLQCPLNVPILLGEIGCDNYVDKERWDHEGGPRGWLGNMTPDQYADMVAWHISHSDTRVVAGLVFLLDYRNNEWRTFDINPASGALLARKDAMVPQAKPPTQPDSPPPFVTHLPSVSTGSDWSRAWPIVLDIEGGLNTDPNDRGNYKPDGTFVGTKWGISANAHPDVDIVNLTKEAALDIYKREYWDAIDADSMAWPLNLAAFDLAVNGGVGRAKQALAEAGHDFNRLNAWRLKWYTRLDQFDRYGPAWIRRVATIMEASK